jgi:hypothetical protein
MYFVRISDKIVQWNTSYEESYKWTRTITTDLQELKKVYIIDARPKSKVCFIRQATESYPIPLLKSNIQKTMRRRKIEQCLSTTQQLLRQDPIEALRRIPIILVEDTQLHPESYDLIVWLMVAHSKGYALTVEDEELILSAMTTSLFSETRYALKIEHDSEIDVDGFSLALRSAYGGMKGDQAFLLRLAKRVNSLDTLTEWIPVPKFPSFSVEQMIPESIDFHCCGSIISWCAQNIHIPLDSIREAIWWHWSSPNVRKIVDLESTDSEKAVHNELIHRISTQNDYMMLEKWLQTYSEIKLKWMLSQKKKVMIQTRLSFI